MQKDIKWFTLVELIVAATILVLLSTIGFYSYVQNLSSARDGVRKTDIAALSSQLRLQKKERWSYPAPGDSFEIQNRWSAIALQGKMNTQVALSTASSLPLDPKMDIPYTYSTTPNRQEFQIAASLENNNNPKALLQGDYSSVSKNILPTLVVAHDSWPVEIVNDPSNKDYFIFNESIKNLPYDFETWNPRFDWATLATLLEEAQLNGYWQNSDFRSCEEIAQAWKRITPDGYTEEYQVRNSSGILVNQCCYCTSTGCVNEAPTGTECTNNG